MSGSSRRSASMAAASRRSSSTRFDAIVPDRAIWSGIYAISGTLEKSLVEIFMPDHAGRLEQARQRLLDAMGGGEDEEGKDEAAGSNPVGPTVTTEGAVPLRRYRAFCVRGVCGLPARVGVLCCLRFSWRCWGIGCAGGACGGGLGAGRCGCRAWDGATPRGCARAHEKAPVRCEPDQGPCASGAPLSRWKG